MSSAQNPSVSPSAPSGPAKKPDRSTVPMLALLVACVVAAYGFSSESALWRWQMPLALVVFGAAWAFWPRGRRAAS